MRHLLLAALLVVGACADDEDESPEVSARCDVFPPALASSLLGDDVEERDFLDVVEATDGPLPAEERPLAEAAAERICIYGPAGGALDVYAAVQLDRGLFRSVEEFRQAWGERVEILDEPGLAATYERSDDATWNLSALVNDAGDSVALSVHGADPGREELFAALREVVELA